MSSLVIVAIPEKDDYVWKISSEKVPHLTILFLGEATENSHVSDIQSYVEHAASMLQPFWLEASDRGVLGDDEADVVFFEDAWELPRVRNFRGALLKNENIKTAYDSVEQFPEWNPHLTLGYPAKPAKTDDRDYPGIHSVRFDRIALWFGDSEGPEFKLKTPKYYYDDMELAMGATAGKEAVEGILQHHGVKGMKWGVRNTARRIKAASDANRAEFDRQQAIKTSPKDVRVKTIKKRGKTQIKLKGGENHPASEDAINSRVAAQKLRKSGTHALTNQELQALSTRLNLELQVARLDAAGSTRSNGEKFVRKQLKNKKNQQVIQDTGTKAITALLAKKAAKAAAVAAVA